jgi:hypothetical protein
MYRGGGGGGGGGVVGQKFPNDETNFRIFHGIRSHEGVCYPENEDANLQTKIRISYAQTYYRSMQCRRNLFLMGAENEGRRPEEIFTDLESLKCHFLDFGEVLTEL